MTSETNAPESEPNQKITADQAALIQRKNVENIVRKVSAGKVLTAHELELLDTLAPEQVPARSIKPRSWVALAKLLNVARKTVWDLRDHHDGPQTLDVEAWQKFLERRAAEHPHHKNEDHQSSELKDLRLKLLRAQAGKEEATRKLKELELERAEAGLVPMAEAKATIRRVLAPLRALLDALPKACAVHANSIDPQQAEQAVRESLQKLYGMMQKAKKDNAAKKGESRRG